MLSETLNLPRIHQLDNRLANQIAAGEVVERPASVVKELLENSIDAGASRIEVDIERGGTRLIRVTDNGCGIVKQDLQLALSRHATSKIASSEDLAAIESLGFRGEALASIASVAKLTLTSRTVDSEFAWQAIAEGREMAVKIQPASATVGTRIEVRDLFYNTPARLKFLRAEKTEFAHIEEIFKRHALANYSTAFILKHNHKVIRRIPAVASSADFLPRIEAVCGKPFAQNAVEFNCQHELINITGWTGGVSYHRSESDIQYVFVNNRPVKDKMLNHAIRQAFQDKLPAGRMPTFVMFLTVDPSAIDVNVHPTKHEIRFDQQRMVHDLIVHSIMESLTQQPLILEAGHSDTITIDSHRNQHVGLGFSQVDYPKGNRKLSQSALSGSKFFYADSATSASSIDKREVGETQLNKIFQSIDSPQPFLDENSRITNTEHDGDQHYQSQHYQSRHDENQQYDRQQSLSQGLKLYPLGQKHLISLVEQQWRVISIQSFLLEWVKLQRGSTKALASQPLLFPLKISVEPSLFEQLEVNQMMRLFGFDFSPSEDNNIILKKSPIWLKLVANQEMQLVFIRWAELLSEFYAQAGTRSTDTHDSGNEQALNRQLVDALSQNARPIITQLFEQKTNLESNPSIISLSDEMIEKLFQTK